MTRTPNLQLCQWAPTDVVDVGQVNENFTKLDQLGVRADGIDSRIGNVDARLGGEIAAAQTRLSGEIGAAETRLSGKIDGVDTRISTRINGVDARITAVDGKFATTGRIKLKEVVTGQAAMVVAIAINDIDFTRYRAVHVDITGPTKSIYSKLIRFDDGAGCESCDNSSSGMSRFGMLETYYGGTYLTIRCDYQNNRSFMVSWCNTYEQATGYCTRPLAQIQNLVLYSTSDGDPVAADRKLIFWGEF